MSLTLRTDGVVIGLLLAFADGAPCVVFPGNPNDGAIRARSLARLTADDLGHEVALLFEDGDPTRPLVMGRIVDPARALTATAPPDPSHVITATERIEFRVGKSSIVMEKDGHITIRGTYLVSHASAANRIRGGSVNLN